MVFIISEIGVNWEGNFELLKSMVNGAKKAGCDAVKFQAFNKELVEKHPESSRLLKSAISSDIIGRVNEICKDEGIEWFCTPMYPQAVDFLNPYVKRYKIREFDGRQILENSDSEIFKKILSTGKEVIISTEKNPRICKYYNHPKIKWLYCIPKYPSNYEDHDFKHIGNFHGFSNHCRQIIIPLMATILGSEIIEVHITSDKSKDFIDNNVSFDYYELDQLVRYIRICEKVKH